MYDVKYSWYEVISLKIIINYDLTILQLYKKMTKNKLEVFGNNLIANIYKNVLLVVFGLTLSCSSETDCESLKKIIKKENVLLLF